MTQPWESRDDWRTGRIANGKNRGSCIGIVLGPVLVVAGIGISFPIGVAGLAMPPALCALLGTGAMAIVGLLMFIQGLRGWRRSRRFGAATLVLSGVPVPPGGAIEGNLELSFVPSSPARFSVVCTESVSKMKGGRQSGRRTVTRPLGKVAWTVPATDFRPRDSGVTVPFRYDLPAGLPPTSTPALMWPSGTPRHEWTVTCDIEMFGVDFASSYVIPVFSR